MRKCGAAKIWQTIISVWLQIILWYLPEWEPWRESSRCVSSWRRCPKKMLMTFSALHTCRQNALRFVSFCICTWQRPLSCDYETNYLVSVLISRCPPYVRVKIMISHWQTWSPRPPFQQVSLKLRPLSVCISLPAWWAHPTGELCLHLHFG